jgi:hypothetical protein
MDQLQRSMSLYVKWLGRPSEAAEDKEKSLAVSYLGRTMVNHGEEFQPDSEFGNCLIAMGRANERVSAIQETFVREATTTWLESLERSLAMMKEYQVSVLGPFPIWVSSPSKSPLTTTLGRPQEAREPSSRLRRKHHQDAKGET